MKFSVTLTIFILFAVVLWTYVYLTPPAAENPDRARPQSAKLLDISAGDEIREIAIYSKEGQNLVLEKKKDGWHINEPFDYPADPLVVEGLVSALRLTPKEGETKPEKGWEEFGLSGAPLKVGVKTRKQSSSRYLLIGEKSPVAERVYARWEGEETYFLLDRQIKNVFTNSVYSFREKKVFRTPLKNMTKIRFQSGLDAYEIIQGLSGWVWMEPVTFLGTDVAPETADRMLSLVQNTYIKDFVEEGSGIDTGLSGTDESSNSVQIKVWEDTAKDPEILFLGTEVPEKDAYYGRRSGEDTAFIVARGHIMRLFELLSAEADKITGDAPPEPDAVFTPAPGI